MVENMLKTVGNIFIFFLSCTIVLLDARITMEIGAEGLNKNHVMLGQPFTINVIIDEVQGAVSNPILKGFDGCSIRLVGTYMSNINGKTLTKYSYTARIDKLGEYIIGPATVQHQQQTMASNEVRVLVVKDPGVVAQKNKKVNVSGAKAFLRLMIDTEAPFVGQKIGCCLRFYYQDPSLSLQAVGIPELSHFDVKAVSKLESGTTEIEGVSYQYAQWRWDMYPTESGEFVIPAYHADYDVPLKENSNHLLGGLFMFMGNRVDRKRVYSNAVTIKVLPLPFYPDPVHAVGSFERIIAEINPGLVKEGEGMILTIQLEGTGNLEAITIPKLTMPDSLKYYDSNSTIIPSSASDGIAKKKFEFIVQPMKAGDYEIPEQLFTYFDYEKNTYITLRTNPLSVSVMPGAMNAKKDVQAISGSLQSQKNDELVGINKTGPWYPIDRHDDLPEWLFILLFLLPCFYVLYPIFIEKVAMMADKSTRLRRKRSFNRAYKQIYFCKKNNIAKDLYPIFVQWIKEQDDIESIHSIRDMLQKTPTTIDLAAEWNIFLERIMQAAYAQSNDKDNGELCRMAIRWLEYLEKV